MATHVPSVAGRIALFVERERGRFDQERNNVFATAFGHVIRYHEFLQIIVARHQETVAAHRALMDEIHDSLAASGEQTTDQIAQWPAYVLQGRVLALDMECFYLVGDILLDVTARCAWLYFGRHNSPSLNRFTDVVKRCDRFVAFNQLTPPSADLQRCIAELDRRLCHYRDKHVTHPDFRHTFPLSKGFMFSQGRLDDTRFVSLGFGEVGSGSGKEGESPVALLALVEEYLGYLLDSGHREPRPRGRPLRQGLVAGLRAASSSPRSSAARPHRGGALCGSAHVPRPHGPPHGPSRPRMVPHGPEMHLAPPTTGNRKGGERLSLLGLHESRSRDSNPGPAAYETAALSPPVSVSAAGSGAKVEYRPSCVSAQPAEWQSEWQFWSDMAGNAATCRFTVHRLT